MLRRPRRRQTNTRPAFQPVGAGRPRARPNETRNTRLRVGPPKGVVRPPGRVPAAPPVGPVGSGPPPPAAPAAPQVRGPAPRTAASEIMRANAEQGLSGAKNTYRDAVFRAAMALGDPTIFAKLQADPEFVGYQFAVDPNSAMSDLARQEQEGLKTIDTSANAGNTFFSGFRLGDRQQYSNDVSRERLRAVGGFNDALAEYAAALAGAQSQYNQDIGDADIYDIDYALQFDPEPGSGPTAPSSNGGSGGSKGGGLTPQQKHAKSQHKANKAATNATAKAAEKKAKKKAKKK